MKSFLFIIVAVVVLHVQAVQAKFVEHKVQENETAWFVSQIYYGQGAKFTDILKSNQLKSPDEVKPGLVLRIEDPKFDPASPSFPSRIAALRKKRTVQLGLHYNEADVAKKVVVPSEKIRKSASSSLPFSEVKDSKRSLQERAQEELKNRTSNSEAN